MIEPISLVDLAHNYGGVLWQPDGDMRVSSVNIDSRKISTGECFVAIRGERFDAHEFIDQVIERGAESLIVENPMQRQVPQWVVSDSVKALGQLARENRKQFQHPVIAITGSNGKTSVKEMLASILSLSGNVLATKGNLNNHIGVPLTLLRLEAEHRYAVIEMGASGTGEIKYLCELAEPDVALVNNVGEAHIEKFGSRENIRLAKGEIYQGLKKGGTAVVNLDSEGAATYIQSLQDCNVIAYSAESSDAEIRATDIQLDQASCEFQLVLGSDSHPVRLNVPARHSIMNALAAAACAYSIDIPIAQIVEGLQRFGGVKGRLQFLPGLHGVQLIDDSYNASPTSVTAAIEILAALPGKRILVLGDMGELGDEAESMHAQMGRYASDLGLDAVVANGPLSKATVKAFGELGVWFDSQEELISYLRSKADAGVTMLVKGSRSAEMDRVVAQLKAVTQLKKQEGEC